MLQLYILKFIVILRRNLLLPFLQSFILEKGLFLPSRSLSLYTTPFPCHFFVPMREEFLCGRTPHALDPLICLILTLYSWTSGAGFSKISFTVSLASNCTQYRASSLLNDFVVFMRLLLFLLGNCSSTLPMLRLLRVALAYGGV